MKKAILFNVHGLVQGVGFRYFTQRCASKLGLAGYVRNLYDGSVEVYAIGSEEQLDELALYLKKGPSCSRVTGVDRRAVRVDESYRRFGIEL